MYSADLDSVLSMLKRQAVNEQEGLSTDNYEFYFACMDRIDILITEKDSSVAKKQIIQILRTLSYFRPKEQEYKYKSHKASGNFSISDI